MTEKIEISAAFFDQVKHHFLMLRFETRRPSGETQSEMRSCFVVEVEEMWLLVTAGHVVRCLRDDYKEQGLTVSSFRLHDELAGHAYEWGVPFDFDPDQCVVYEEDTGDFAAWFVDELTRQQLEKGGVRPIEEKTWGAPRSPRTFDDLLLIGLPKETIRPRGVKIDLAPALIPIVLLEAPPLVDPPLPEFIWAAGMKQQTPTKVADIDGVSGGPIFGIERLAEGWRYHLAGIQSGWLPKSRVVTFYPAMPFLDSMAKIIRQAKAQVEGRESPSA